MDFDSLTTWVASTGAVGTAAFGIVETLKGTAVGTVGAGRVKELLGEQYWKALEAVYGKGLDGLVTETFRKGADPLAQLLKTGLRLALSHEPSADVLGSSVPREKGEPELKHAAATLRDGARKALADAEGRKSGDGADERLEPPIEESRVESESRAVMGRFEALMSARVDAAVCAAQRRFAAWMQFLAMVLAVAGGVGAAAALGESLLGGLLIGLAAVPVAPVTKDLVALLGHARTALRPGSR